MNLQARKYEFIEQLFKIEKVSIMDKLENLLKNELLEKRDTVEEYNADIDAGIKEIENGEFYTQDDAKKIANKWFK